jgi:hypothetical protein
LARSRRMTKRGCGTGAQLPLPGMDHRMRRDGPAEPVLKSVQPHVQILFLQRRTLHERRYMHVHPGGME